MTCSLCAEPATWLVEWGIVDVAREPRRPGQPVCSTHVGHALDRRPRDPFRLTRLRRPTIEELHAAAAHFPFLPPEE